MADRAEYILDKWLKQGIIAVKANFTYKKAGLRQLLPLMKFRSEIGKQVKDE